MEYQLRSHFAPFVDNELATNWFWKFRFWCFGLLTWFFAFDGDLGAYFCRGTFFALPAVGASLSAVLVIDFPDAVLALLAAAFGLAVVTAANSLLIFCLDVATLSVELVVVSLVEAPDESLNNPKAPFKFIWTRLADAIAATNHI